MTDKTIDRAKGRIKEAVGALTGSRHLKNQGRADQAKASAKDTIDNAIDNAADALQGHQEAKR